MWSSAIGMLHPPASNDHMGQAARQLESTSTATIEWYLQSSNQGEYKCTSQWAARQVTKPKEEWQL